LNPWSTRAPVELSNRELHRQGWEPDGVCLKVAVTETRAVPGGQRFCDGTNSRHRRNGIGRTATRAYSNSASSDFGRGRTQGSDELAPGTPEQALEGEAPDSESTSRTGKSLANGGWRLSVTRQAGCQTRPELLVCGGAPAGIELGPHPYHRCSGGSRRHAAPHVSTQSRGGRCLPGVGSWGDVRLRIAQFLTKCLARPRESSSGGVALASPGLAQALALPTDGR
jgi:hypothetical protein